MSDFLFPSTYQPNFHKFVLTRNDLPEEGNEENDTRYVEADGVSYAWVSGAWLHGNCSRVERRAAQRALRRVPPPAGRLQQLALLAGLRSARGRAGSAGAVRRGAEAFAAVQHHRARERLTMHNETARWKVKAEKRLAHINVQLLHIRTLKQQVAAKQYLFLRPCGHAQHYTGSYWNLPNLLCEVCELKKQLEEARAAGPL